MICANNRVHYGLIVVYCYLDITIPHYHQYADLSECIELMKCLSDIFCLKCVSKIRSVLSIISHAIYGTVCTQLSHFSYDDCENTCTRSYYHYQIGSMTHLPLFLFKSWNNGMRCMSFYILIGSDNGLAPTRRQSIIWTNDGNITDTYMGHSTSTS